MKYMLLICDEEAVWGRYSEAERQQMMGEYRKFTLDIQASGHYVGGAQLPRFTTDHRAGSRKLGVRPREVVDALERCLPREGAVWSVAIV